MDSSMPHTPEPSYGIQEVPFPEEVDSVIKDVAFAVKEIYLSEKMPVTSITAHLNIVTIECRRFFVRMSPSGFKILGDELDTENVKDGASYETIQALLDSVSPGYRRMFSEALTAKLNALEKTTS